MLANGFFSLKKLCGVSRICFTTIIKLLILTFIRDKFNVKLELQQWERLCLLIRHKSKRNYLIMECCLRVKHIVISNLFVQLLLSLLFSLSASIVKEKNQIFSNIEFHLILTIFTINFIAIVLTLEGLWSYLKSIIVIAVRRKRFSSSANQALHFMILGERLDSKHEVHRLGKRLWINFLKLKNVNNCIKDFTIKISKKYIKFNMMQTTIKRLILIGLKIIYPVLIQSISILLVNIILQTTLGYMLF